MFETLSRRSTSLIDQQLSLIERLESDEEDPKRLQSLFRLDHLAARMRRNSDSLLVLAGAKVPRDQAEPVPVAAIINAAASEVEDYTRVVTATVPESEIHGAVAGDLVHLLAEPLDNALRYSPPISQVRVSAVHTGNGALVIEVSDIGIGMTASDLRVANTRLQSGGEVNPYTARHMGLFVVGRLAAQHSLVVRMRSTIAGEPNSGTTAGVYVPVELLMGAVGAPDQFDAPDTARRPTHTRAHTTPPPQRRRDADTTNSPCPQEYLNGIARFPVSLLPQRNPGASGISDIPTSLVAPATESAEPAAVASPRSVASGLDAGADARTSPFRSGRHPSATRRHRPIHPRSSPRAPRCGQRSTEGRITRPSRSSITRGRACAVRRHEPSLVRRCRTTRSIRQWSRNGRSIQDHGAAPT